MTPRVVWALLLFYVGAFASLYFKLPILVTRVIGFSLVIVAILFSCSQGWC